MRESIFDILLNLKQIIFTSDIMMAHSFDTPHFYRSSNVNEFENELNKKEKLLQWNEKKNMIFTSKKNKLSSFSLKQNHIHHESLHSFTTPLVNNKRNHLDSNFIRSFLSKTFQSKFQNNVFNFKESKIANRNSYVNNKNFLSKANDFCHPVNIGYICVKGPATIYGKDLKLPKGVKCLNPDQYIVTLSDDGVFFFRFSIDYELENQLFFNRIQQKGSLFFPFSLIELNQKPNFFLKPLFLTVNTFSLPNPKQKLFEPNKWKMVSNNKKKYSTEKDYSENTVSFISKTNKNFSPLYQMKVKKSIKKKKFLKTNILKNFNSLWFSPKKFFNQTLKTNSLFLQNLYLTKINLEKFNFLYDSLIQKKSLCLSSTIETLNNENFIFFEKNNTKLKLNEFHNANSRDLNFFKSIKLDNYFWYWKKQLKKARNHKKILNTPWFLENVYQNFFICLKNKQRWFKINSLALIEKSFQLKQISAPLISPLSENTLSENSCTFQNSSLLANIKKTCLINLKIKHSYYKSGCLDRFLIDLLKLFKPSINKNFSKKASTLKYSDQFLSTWQKKITSLYKEKQQFQMNPEREIFLTFIPTLDIFSAKNQKRIKKNSENFNKNTISGSFFNQFYDKFYNQFKLNDKSILKNKNFYLKIFQDKLNLVIKNFLDQGIIAEKTFYSQLEYLKNKKKLNFSSLPISNNISQSLIVFIPNNTITLKPSYLNIEPLFHILKQSVKFHKNQRILLRNLNFFFSVSMSFILLVLLSNVFPYGGISWKFFCYIQNFDRESEQPSSVWKMKEKQEKLNIALSKKFHSNISFGLLSTETSLFFSPRGLNLFKLLFLTSSLKNSVIHSKLIKKNPVNSILSKKKKLKKKKFILKNFFSLFENFFFNLVVCQNNKLLKSQFSFKSSSEWQNQLKKKKVKTFFVENFLNHKKEKKLNHFFLSLKKIKNFNILWNSHHKKKIICSKKFHQTFYHSKIYFSLRYTYPLKYTIFAHYSSMGWFSKTKQDDVSKALFNRLFFLLSGPFQSMNFSMAKKTDFSWLKTNHEIIENSDLTLASHVLETNFLKINTSINHPPKIIKKNFYFSPKNVKPWHIPFNESFKIYTNITMNENLFSFKMFNRASLLQKTDGTVSKTNDFYLLNQEENLSLIENFSFLQYEMSLEKENFFIFFPYQSFLIPWTSQKDDFQIKKMRDFNDDELLSLPESEEKKVTLYDESSLSNFEIFKDTYLEKINSGTLYNSVNNSFFMPFFVLFNHILSEFHRFRSIILSSGHKKRKNKRKKFISLKSKPQPKIPTMSLSILLKKPISIKKSSLDVFFFFNESMANLDQNFDFYTFLRKLIAYSRYLRKKKFFIKSSQPITTKILNQETFNDGFILVNSVFPFSSNKNGLFRNFDKLNNSFKPFIGQNLAKLFSNNINNHFYKFKNNSNVFDKAKKYFSISKKDKISDAMVFTKKTNNSKKLKNVKKLNKKIKNTAVAFQEATTPILEEKPSQFPFSTFSGLIFENKSKKDFYKSDQGTLNHVLNFFSVSEKNDQKQWMGPQKKTIQLYRSHFPYTFLSREKNTVFFPNLMPTNLIFINSEIETTSTMSNTEISWWKPNHNFFQLRSPSKLLLQSIFKTQTNHWIRNKNFLLAYLNTKKFINTPFNENDDDSLFQYLQFCQNKKSLVSLNLMTTLKSLQEIKIKKENFVHSLIEKDPLLYELCKIKEKKDKLKGLKFYLDKKFGNLYYQPIKKVLKKNKQQHLTKILNSVKLKTPWNNKNLQKEKLSSNLSKKFSPYFQKQTLSKIDETSSNFLKKNNPTTDFTFRNTSLITSFYKSHSRFLTYQFFKTYHNNQINNFYEINQLNKNFSHEILWQNFFTKTVKKKSIKHMAKTQWIMANTSLSQNTTLKSKNFHFNPLNKKTKIPMAFEILFYRRFLWNSKKITLQILNNFIISLASDRKFKITTLKPLFKEAKIKKITFFNSFIINIPMIKKYNSIKLKLKNKLLFTKLFHFIPFMLQPKGFLSLHVNQWSQKNLNILNLSKKNNILSKQIFYFSNQLVPFAINQKTSFGFLINDNLYYLKNSIFLILLFFIHYSFGRGVNFFPIVYLKKYITGNGKKEKLFKLLFKTQNFELKKFLFFKVFSFFVLFNYSFLFSFFSYDLSVYHCQYPWFFARQKTQKKQTWQKMIHGPNFLILSSWFFHKSELNSWQSNQQFYRRRSQNISKNKTVSLVTNHFHQFYKFFNSELGSRIFFNSFSFSNLWEKTETNRKKFFIFDNPIYFEIPFQNSSLFSNNQKNFSQILFYNLQLSGLKKYKNYFLQIAFGKNFYEQTKIQPLSLQNQKVFFQKSLLLENSGLMFKEMKNVSLTPSISSLERILPTIYSFVGEKAIKQENKWKIFSNFSFDPQLNFFSIGKNQDIANLTEHKLKRVAKGLNKSLVPIDWKLFSFAEQIRAFAEIKGFYAFFLKPSFQIGNLEQFSPVIKTKELPFKNNKIDLWSSNFVSKYFIYTTSLESDLFFQNFLDFSFEKFDFNKTFSKKPTFSISSNFLTKNKFIQENKTQDVIIEDFNFNRLHVSNQKKINAKQFNQIKKNLFFPQASQKIPKKTFLFSSSFSDQNFYFMPKDNTNNFSKIDQRKKKLFGFSKLTQQMETNLLSLSSESESSSIENPINQLDGFKNFYLISRQLGFDKMGIEAKSKNLQVFPWFKNDYQILLRYFTIKESLNPIYKVNYIIENFEMAWDTIPISFRQKKHALLREREKKLKNSWKFALQFQNSQTLFPLNRLTKQFSIGSILDHQHYQKQNLKKHAGPFTLVLSYPKFYLLKKKKKYLPYKIYHHLQQSKFYLPLGKNIIRPEKPINKWQTWYSFLIQTHKTSLIVLNNYYGIIPIPKWKNENSFLKINHQANFQSFLSLKNKFKNDFRISQKNLSSFSLKNNNIQNFQANQIHYIENDIKNEYIQIDIWTNGSISPRQSLVNAFKKLFKLFSHLNNNISLKNNNILKPEIMREFVLLTNTIEEKEEGEKKEENKLSESTLNDHNNNINTNNTHLTASHFLKRLPSDQNHDSFERGYHLNRDPLEIIDDME